MTLTRKELPIPPGAIDASEGFEIARVWIAEGKQHVSLMTDIWEDPAAWGIILVDLAKHVADSYDKRGAFTTADALSRIKDGFDAEWAQSTDEPTGDFLDESS